jgi:RNA polymerase sigma-70 factor (ECF subfamily)
MAESSAKSLFSPEHNDSLDCEVLVKRFNQGDDLAFDRIVKEYSADIATLAARLLGWPDNVEDIVQDVFLAAFLGLKKFHGQCSLKTWLFTITINKCRTFRYKQMLRLKHFHLFAGKTDPPQSRSADQTPMESETFDGVQKAIMALSPKYREPIILKYLQELPTEKIAQILGISKNVLYVRISRAKQSLKKDLVELIEK